MLNERIFILITRLIYGRWTRHYDEHHSPYEDACMASLGPFRLSANYCSHMYLPVKRLLSELV